MFTVETGLMDFGRRLLSLQLLYPPGKISGFVNDVCNAELLTDMQRYL